MLEHTDPELRDIRSRGKRHSGDNIKGRRSYKLNEEGVIFIREQHDKNISMETLARCYGVTRQTISNVIHRKTWRHI